jgi:hypothetical protein
MRVEENEVFVRGSRFDKGCCKITLNEPSMIGTMRHQLEAKELQHLNNVVLEEEIFTSSCAITAAVASIPMVAINV